MRAASLEPHPPPSYERRREPRSQPQLSNLKLIRGELKKSGLASEAITRVLRKLEKNGKKKKSCGILITFAKFWYIVALGMLKIKGDMTQNIKK